MTLTDSAPQRRALLLVGVCALALSVHDAWAQMPRPIPDDSPIARVIFLSPTEVSVDGATERVGPGVRVHDARNQMVFMSQLVGQRAVVRLRRDAIGRIFEIWILTPAEQEAAQRLRKQQQRRR